jgi:hypothetical protein
MEAEVFSVPELGLNWVFSQREEEVGFD